MAFEYRDDTFYLYNCGKDRYAYRLLGAHADERDGERGFRFAVWAPGAKSVHVIGDFNDWKEDGAALYAVSSSGVFAGFIPGIKEGCKYKYLIETDNGKKLYKADPFAFKAEVRPGTASVTHTLSYEWHDGAWLKARKNFNSFEAPKNIYEVHLGAWKRHKGEAGAGDEGGAGRFYTYRDLADELIPYVLEMGYNYMEIMPVMEHPLDASWGYQVTGYFAVTSRYGTPEDFMYFTDKAHEAGIGVILDWVPGHFCRDEFGLGAFNGHKLYEIRDHKQWGTYIFDFGRKEVRSFLLSNAMFYLKEFHADGLRVDGVSSMLYLNFGIDDPKEKIYNIKGTEENLEAISFLQEFNSMVGEEFPGVFTVAEESTAWPMVTYPPGDGGLGFHYKWDMGWMNDTLSYFKTDFPFRKGCHEKLTFSMMYAFSENFILPLSHDEVVHGKCSLITRMPGDYWRQFAGLRLLMMYQMTHPGGKLSFMGNENAPFIEWREWEELEWFMLGYEAHGKHHLFVKELNGLYLNEPSLYALDGSWDGFYWLDADNSKQSILIYIRSAKKTEPVRFLPDKAKEEDAALPDAGICGDNLFSESGTAQEKINEKSGGAAAGCVCAGDGGYPDAGDVPNFSVVILNFAVMAYGDFRVGVPYPGTYKEIFSSDDVKYGGSGCVNAAPACSKEIPAHGMANSVSVKVPPVGGCILKRISGDPSLRSG